MDVEKRASGREPAGNALPSPAAPSPAIAETTQAGPSAPEPRAARGPVAGPPPLDLVPRSSLQPRPDVARGRAVLALAGAVALHGGFAGLLVWLMDWREIAPAPERAVPVEIVARMPEPTKPPAPKPPAPKPPSPAPPAPEAPTPKPDPAPSAALVAPPPEAAPAATEAVPKPPTPAPASAAQAGPTSTPLPEAPKALTSRDGDTSVAPRSPTPPRAPERSAPAPRTAAAKPDPAAQLRAALPLDLSRMPSSFRAVLAGGGTQASEDYRGLVFGRLGRVRGVTERARAAGLHGDVLVAFSVDDGGAPADLHVLRSSGTPALDAMALDMVREAAPFPPPPRGAQRLFTPLLSFGGP